MGHAVTEFSFFNHIVSWIFLFFCMEVILMGPGDWSTPFGFSARKVLFVATVFIVILNYFSSRTFNVFDVKWFFCGILFFYFFGLVIPVLYGVDLALSFADLRPLAGLLFLPFFSDFYKKSGRWAKDRKLISAALLVLTLLHILMLVLGTISRDIGEFAISTLRSIYEPGIEVINSKIAISYTPEGSIRVQWGSSCLLLLGLYFSLVQLMEKKSKYNVIYFVVICLAILSTQSRGLFFALSIGVVHYLIFYYCLPLKKLKFLNYFLGLTITLVASMLILPFFSPEFLEYFGLTREGSDDKRFLQITPLLLNWINHLLFGSGFGSGIDIIRSEVAPYAYEVSILSLLMKVGVVGLFVGLILCSTLLMRLFNGIVYYHQKKKLVIIYSMVFVYVLASNTNPYLSNFFGMLVFYCFALEMTNHNKPV